MVTEHINICSAYRQPGFLGPMPRCCLVVCMLLWLVVIALPTQAWGATPILEWRMDDVGWNGVPQVVPNARGDRYHGTWVNPNATTSLLAPVLPGQYGTCGYGQFTRSRYVDGGNPDFGLTNQLTVMAWVRWSIDPETGNSRATILANNSTDTPHDGQFWLRHDAKNRRYEFAVQTTDGRRSVVAYDGPKPVEGRWQHVAGVYDGATLTLYVDGMPSWATVQTGYLTHNSAYRLTVGRWAHPSEEHRAFQGAIDEVRIYKVALSPAEVQEAIKARRNCGTAFVTHQAPEANPVVDVRMDERLWRGTTEKVRDRSGNGFHGVAMNGATLGLDAPAIQGTKSTCAYGVFDGAEQYLDFGRPDLALAEQVTVMAWVRWGIDASTGNPWANVATNNRTSRSDQGQFWLQHNSDNSRFEFVVQTSEGKKRVLSTTQPAPEVWYHVAGVYDGHNLLIFVDGVLENLDTHAGGFVSQSDHQLTIGRWAHSSQNYRAFRGSIDEVRIYSEGLPAAQIARAAVAARECKNTSLATPPQLHMTSHVDSIGVLPAGFTLSGTINDAGNDLTQLALTIDDPLLGRTVDHQPLQVNATTGAWTFVVTPNLISPGKTITVSLTATDAEQTTTAQKFTLEVAPNPLALWHLDARPAWSGATGEVMDVSGNQFHGRAINGATVASANPVVPGDPGTCGYGTFNGSDHFLDLGNPNFKLSKKFTVMAWVRWAVEPATGNSRATIISNNRPTESDTGQFWLHHGRNNGRLAFAIQTDLGRQEVRSTTQPQQGVWYHVAGVYDGSQMWLFVNGREEQTVAHGGRFVFDPQGHLTIGRWAYAGNAYRAFQGDIDEVHLYKEALSAAQIAAIVATSQRCDARDESLPPVLTVASHHHGGAVTPGGFTLTGAASDGAAAVRPIVNVDDPILGRTVNGREASIDINTGQWLLPVAAHELTPGRTITVNISAVDSSGTATRLTLKLQVVPLARALWHFDATHQWRGDPGEVVDASGHGYAGQAMHGTRVLYDTPALGDSLGTCGYAAFNGTYQYIDIGSRNLRLTNQLTLLAWARWSIDPATGNARATIVSNNSVSQRTTGQFWLQHNSDNSRFQFAVQTDIGLATVTSVTQPQPEVWYHLAGVYDGSQMRLYVNGIPEDRKTHSGNFVSNPEYRLQFARWAVDSQNYRAFAGSIDEVRLYKTALSASEIMALAHETRVCPTAPALSLDVDARSLVPEVQDTGFLVSGHVEAGHTLERLEVRLTDSVRGSAVGQYTVDITPQGKWAVWVDGAQLSAGQTLRVEVMAFDATGDSVTQSFHLNVIPFDRQSRHLLSRITFGATPALLDQVATLGTAHFLAQQLDPQSINDSPLQAMLAGFVPATRQELQAYALLHAIHSRRQLQEVMTWFWDNHFNTDINKHRSVAYELTENRAFRAHALGRFRDLLEISAKSPAMLVYLDSVANVKKAPNENYARELLELHTLGVDGGFTQTDVEQVAKAFTGWQVSNEAFFFNADRHNTDDKVVLGRAIPGGGVEEGEEILRLLANDPSTAWFICTKLSALFVSDTPPEPLVQRCATKFLDTVEASDQIAQVVHLLLTSLEFLQEGNYRSKIKTPLEFVAGLVRNLLAETSGNDLPSVLQSMGQELFENPIPTGYAESGEDWINTQQLLERIKFVNRTANNTPGSNQTNVKPVTFFKTHGYETAEGIVSFLFTLALGNDYTGLERTIALGLLTDDGTTVFDLEASDADEKLRRLIGTVLSYPGYLYQ